MADSPLSWFDAWLDPPPQLAMQRDEVHLWRIVLDQDDATRDGLCRLLSVNEMVRMQRYRLQRHRERFAVKRGVLRTILGAYLGRPPQSVRFDYGPQGKPRLAGQQGGDDLRFNLSDSQGLAVVAVAWGREVGVDIEAIDPHRPTQRLAERFFTPREVAHLAALPLRERPQAFFRVWTQKEACIKARGGGLSIPLSSFEVPLTPTTEPALVQSGQEGELRRWTLRLFEPAPAFAGALAVESAGWKVRCWSWRPI
ncbi:MAG TPA: 4'-phosphopantetheinyl transferase superfamily protein [Phycisphaeraceae bacterium]